jgi:Tol biopolymer transport system component
VNARVLFGAAAAAVTLAAGAACVVGNQPWIAPRVRLVYTAEGAGRAGIRFLVAREDGEIALTRGVGDADPAFDHASGRVYFASRENGTWDLWNVQLSGEGRTRITSTPGINEREPVPSPDGTALYFTSDESGTDQIHRSAMDGTASAVVTSGPPHSGAAFDSAGTTLTALEGTGEGRRLVSLSVAGSGGPPATPLAAAPALTPVGPPSVRRDGEVVYACAGEGGSDICLLVPGEPPRRLTEGPAEDRDPAWSPDGALIAFSSNRDDDNFEIFAMRRDGSHVRRLTEERGPDGQPAWVP